MKKNVELEKDIEIIENIGQFERQSEYQDSDTYNDVLKASADLQQNNYLINKAFFGILEKVPEEKREEIANNLKELIKLANQQSLFFQKYDHAIAKYDNPEYI